MAIAVGVITYLLLPVWLQLEPVARCTLAWNAGAIVYLAGVCWIMAASDVATIRSRAAEIDESAVIIPIVVIAAIAASLLAAAGVLALAADAKAAGGAGKATQTGYLILAGTTILLSWCVMQAVFTIHYAHEFYAPPGGDAKPETSLEFAGDDKPDYWDFLYFAATVGATSQTSDTAIASRKMRRLVTLHAVISFFFNTIVLALTINLAASLIA